MRTLPADNISLADAVRCLRSGEIVAYPTETVYGLGVDPFNPEALERLYRCKGRPESNPVLLIVADAAQLAPLVAEISPQARACIDAFWPGPLSILFPRAATVPDAVTAGTNWICARCPGADFPRELCAAFGGAITSTSANKSGEPPAICARDFDLPGVALLLDGGTLGRQPPSTIVNPQTGQVLREGAIPAEQLLRTLHGQ